MELVLSDTLHEEGLVVLDAVRRRLRADGVDGELVLTGAVSAPGALTTGDVDLHLRVDGGFDEAVERVGRLFPAAERPPRQPTLAVFTVPGGRETGLAVTPVGSEHDVRFRRAWELLRSDPALLAEYNELKRSWAGTPDYLEAKTRFFDRLARRT